MAILRSNDGKFYDISDDQLEGKMVPAEKIKEKLSGVGVGPTPGPVGPGPQMTVPGTGGQVVIQIYTSGGEVGGGYAATPVEGEGEGDVEAHGHGYCWRRNCFSNCWYRNCWRNSCYR